MQRLARRLLLASGLVVTAGLVATVLMEETLGERAVAAVRSRLRTDLEVGGASISLWRAFPYVRVGMRDVRLGGYPEGEFLVADELTSLISWADLLFGEGYTFHTARLKGATVTVYRGADRQGNWLVLEPRDSASAPGEISFELSRALLEDVRVDYRDDATDTRGRFRIDDGELAGRFASTQYTLTGQLAGASDYLELGDMRYVEDFDAAADFSLDIDLAANRYTFGHSTVTLDGMPVDLAGSFLLEPRGTTYDLQLRTDRGELGALLRALPAQWVTPGVRALRTEGAFALEGTIAGRHDARHAPAIRFGGSLHNGALHLPALRRRATDVSFRLSYTNGEDPGMRGSQLILANLNAQLDGQPVNGNFAWTDFLDPFYDVEVSGTIPLAWFDELSDELDFGGRLTLRDARLRGRHRYLADPQQARRVRTTGAFLLERAEAHYAGETYALDARDIRLAGARLHIGEGSVEAHGNRLAVELDLDNLVPYLLGDETQELRVSGTVATPELDLGAWVAAFGDGRAAGARARPAADPEAPLVDGLRADVRLRADRVRYGRIDARRFSGSCTLDGDALGLRGEAYGMEGHWEVDGELALRNAVRLSAKLACSEVNVTELFEQTDDLGQDVVEARHIEGQMTTRAYVEAAWHPDGTLDDDRLHVWANVGLTDGELRDFEMLQALSRYVRSDELRHIRFTDTENWIEVDGQGVYLPAMFIQSTAANFTVAGEHSFGHDVDYGVQVNGGQVILHKWFGKRPGTEFVPDRRRSGFLRTGVSIEGSLLGDRYDVARDKGKVRRQFRASQRRKDAIRAKLVPLFGHERLIDDYDSEGYRLRGQASVAAVAEVPPARTPLPFAGGIAGDERPLIGRPDAPAPAPAVTVDQENFIDFGDEDEPVAPVAPGDDAGAPTPRPVLSGADQPLFGPKPTPSKPSPVEIEDGEYLEFEEPDGR